MVRFQVYYDATQSLTSEEKNSSDAKSPHPFHGEKLTQLIILTTLADRNNPATWQASLGFCGFGDAKLVGGWVRGEMHGVFHTRRR